ncbi:ATP-binding protein [Sphaerimonospora cavernae]|uniref:ATP-binding protein n=1 Tax=Sphaerimonospora cavernae TaxID=1740611 RepID=A0ABV6UCM1_9ACTN
MATLTSAHPPYEVAAAPFAVTAACQGCGACLLTCPEHAIRPGADDGTLVVLADRCSGCGECVEVCPVDAITETGTEGRTPTWTPMRTPTPTEVRR